MLAEYRPRQANGARTDQTELSSNVWRNLLKKEVEASAGAVLPPSGSYSGEMNRDDMELHRDWHGKQVFDFAKA